MRFLSIAWRYPPRRRRIQAIQTLSQLIGFLAGRKLRLNRHA
jgi:hypothetical protein